MAKSETKTKTTKAKVTKAKPAKEKKVKDPNAPKKPCGAYMFFCKDKRAEVKASDPDLSTTQIGKRMGELWKEASDEEKKKYFEEAAADKERYAAAIKAYSPKEADADDSE